MSLPPWHERRASGYANHFNPAYCGILVYEFVRSYEKESKSPAPIALVFCALPIALHPATRECLPRSTATRLLPWLENYRGVRVGFSDRARNLCPYIREALHYAAARQAISFGRGGVIIAGPKQASFTPVVLNEATTDIRGTVKAIRFIARWFAAAGDTPTILAAWGIRL